MVVEPRVPGPRASDVTGHTALGAFAANIDAVHAGGWEGVSVSSEKCGRLSYMACELCVCMTTRVLAHTWALLHRWKGWVPEPNHSWGGAGGGG